MFFQNRRMASPERACAESTGTGEKEIREKVLGEAKLLAARSAECFAGGFDVLKLAVGFGLPTRGIQQDFGLIAVLGHAVSLRIQAC